MRERVSLGTKEPLYSLIASMQNLVSKTQHRCVSESVVQPKKQIDKIIYRMIYLGTSINNITYVIFMKTKAKPFPPL